MTVLGSIISQTRNFHFFVLVTRQRRNDTATQRTKSQRRVSEGKLIKRQNTYQINQNKKNIPENIVLIYGHESVK